MSDHPTSPRAFQGLFAKWPNRELTEAEKKEGFAMLDLPGVVEWNGVFFCVCQTGTYATEMWDSHDKKWRPLSPEQEANFKARNG